MKIKHGEITTKKVGRVWKASVIVTHPIKIETSMQGKSEAIAIEKLQLFLEGKPYSHLYN